MKLEEARKLGIKYCEENDINYTYISHDTVREFYLTDEKEDKHTVFFLNKNGSLNAYRGTNYAVEFHKELRRRKQNRRKNDKRKVAEVYNHDYVETVVD